MCIRNRHGAHSCRNAVLRFLTYTGHTFIFHFLKLHELQTDMLNLQGEKAARVAWRLENFVSFFPTPVQIEAACIKGLGACIKGLGCTTLEEAYKVQTLQGYSDFKKKLRLKYICIFLKTCYHIAFSYKRCAQEGLGFPH